MFRSYLVSFARYFDLSIGRGPRRVASHTIKASRVGTNPQGVFMVAFCLGIVLLSRACLWFEVLWLWCVRKNIEALVSQCCYSEESQDVLYIVVLGLVSPFFSTIVLFEIQPFSLAFWRFSRKKDPWKEWRRYP